jgi:hypothetical protein
MDNFTPIHADLMSYDPDAAPRDTGHAMAKRVGTRRSRNLQRAAHLAGLEYGRVIATGDELDHDDVASIGKALIAGCGGRLIEAAEATPTDAKLQAAGLALGVDAYKAANAAMAAPGGATGTGDDSIVDVPLEDLSRDERIERINRRLVPGYGA